MGSLVCPEGHSREFASDGVTSTLMGWRQTYDGNGKPLNRDPNYLTYSYTCMDCGSQFSLKKQYGEVIETIVHSGPDKRQIHLHDPFHPNAEPRLERKNKDNT
jgi:hypothetical protein